MLEDTPVTHKFTRFRSAFYDERVSIKISSPLILGRSSMSRQYQPEAFESVQGWLYGFALLESDEPSSVSLSSALSFSISVSFLVSSGLLSIRLAIYFIVRCCRLQAGKPDLSSAHVWHEFHPQSFLVLRTYLAGFTTITVFFVITICIRLFQPASWLLHPIAP